MAASVRSRIRRLARLAPRVDEHLCALVVSRGVGCPGIGVEPDGPDVEWSRTCPGAPDVILRLPAEAAGVADFAARFTAEQRVAYRRAAEAMILIDGPAASEGEP